jgi:hypothetical protein
VSTELEARICGQPCANKAMLRAQLDLNGDGRTDLILFPEAGRGQGGGPFFAFLDESHGFRPVADFGSQPWCLEALETRSHGVRDLRGFFRHEGVWIFKFDGEQYRKDVGDGQRYRCRSNLRLEQLADLRTWEAFQSPVSDAR